MNRIAWIVFAVTVSLSTGAHCQRIPVDKQMHLAAGAIIGGMSASDPKAKYPFWNAVLFSTVCGVGKEFMDIGTGVPEVNDAIATTVGGVVGGAAVYYARKQIDRWAIKRQHRYRYKKRKRR